MDLIHVGRAALQACLVVVALLPCAANSRYAFEAIERPGAFATAALGINNGGDVVGWYQDDPQTGALHGYVLSDGVYATLPFEQANDINDQGQIVGMRLVNDRWQGVLYDSGVVTPIVFPGATVTDPKGINDRGDIVGAYLDATGAYHAFLYRNQQYFELNANIATGINSAGVIVGLSGYEAFVLENGVQSTFNAPGSEHELTMATGIDNQGVIVGLSLVSRNDRGFLLDDGSFTFLTYQERRTQLLAINDRGQLLGNWSLGGQVGYFLASPEQVSAVPEPHVAHLLVAGLLLLLGHRSLVRPSST